MIVVTMVTGNNFGPEETTPQETFVNCADVKITVKGGPLPVLPKMTREILNFKTDQFVSSYCD